MPAWTSVTVGVASLDEALQLWVDTFGFEIRFRKSGPDAGQAGLWNLSSGDILEQAVVATPGEQIGLVHLVQFTDPDAPVRHQAEVFDLCPKNLDIYAQDLPDKHRLLLENGYRFRTDTHSEVTAPNGVSFREIHMPVQDDVNIVLLEILGLPLPFSPAGYAGVGPLITIVGDADAEKAFYRDLFELELLSDNILEGPEIERMIGLPPGAALDVSIWGDESEPMGQIEIIEYRGTQGSNLYPRARPKSLGILHVSYQSQDLDRFRERLTAHEQPWIDHGTVNGVIVTGDTISLLSPAGFRIEVFEPE